jgi:hypothetical protein
MRRKITFERIWNKVNDTVYLYLRTYYNKRKRSKDYNEINKYVMFVGYPRSGHSLIGAILDAHPNIILSHELDVLNLVQHTRSKKTIFSMIIARSEWFARKGCVWRGYVYKVPNQWQGKYTALKVIGDKKGGASSKRLGSNSDLLLEIKDIVQKEMVLIHVIRNPFDNITTRARGGSHVMREVNDELLLATIEEHFRDVEIISKIKKESKFPMLDIYNENFIADPKSEIKKMCNFLGVDNIDENYLSDCASIVFASPKKTRNQINWKPEFIELVQKQINKYDFLKGYSYYTSVILLLKLASRFIICANDFKFNLFAMFA